ncbi:MAG TPA: hypothetical protein VH138_15955 [Vicinamibacterales bacterium]|jgi:hypothetical protein|nr:hypothetical protein [Vicinamibacterales bacterium]
MLPGLILTVGLISQSIAGLVSAPRNPDAPRFVNIGEDIVESSTARPVPPASVCAPDVSASAPAVEPVRVIVEVHVKDDESDGVPADVAEADQGIPYDQMYGGIAFVPVSVRRGHRPIARPLGSVHSQMHVAAHSAPPPLLPPFQTVMLPQFRTVMLPQLVPTRAR